MPLAMASSQTLDMNLTPNKRKRESCRFNINGLPTTEAGTSTADPNKENRYAYNAFMEVKSLSDLIPNRALDNPFEVLRKPPKKKKKQDFQDSCFTNPALNLNATEHIVNPYEIKRPQPLSIQRDTHCFVNTGLNIRVPEKEQRNPFEIVRNPVGNGVENNGLELSQQPVSRAIGVPFTPTVGCRINFTDIPLESLTPCSMLANKLVLNTPGVIESTPKKPVMSSAAVEHMSIISEESIDINEELDCYQLELENSINEAKLIKKKRRSSGRKRNLMDLKNIQTFAARLNQPDEYTQVSETEQTDTEPVKDETYLVQDETNVEHENIVTLAVVPRKHDVEFEEVADTSDDDFNFKNPAPFVRTFRRKSTRKQPTVLPSTSTEKPVGLSAGIRNSFRNSMRKLMHVGQQPKKDTSVEKLNTEESGNIFSNIRQSFRRKATTKLVESTDEESSHEISIMVDKDRPVFRQVRTIQKAGQLKYAGAAAGGDEDTGLISRKTSLRSSFRQSTKDVQRQVMKSMFKKNVEEYQFQ